ncbi:MAG: DUF192 domain-containing protein [Candidatus Liptonbacteria bacterium]|nr:DUF192 domain-containing protein [Candidatus Liptonbacteria bacterium]
MKLRAVFIFWFIAAVLAVGLGLGSLWWGYVISGQTNPPLARTTLTIRDTTLSVEIANTTTTRMRGLSGRAGLAEDQGMLFIFGIPGPYGFWMRDMRFPIDIVWIRNGKIVGFSENLLAPIPTLQPGQTEASGSPSGSSSLLKLQAYFPPGMVDQVLEVPAGAVRRYGWQAGDGVTIKAMGEE